MKIVFSEFSIFSRMADSGTISIGFCDFSFPNDISYEQRFLFNSLIFKNLSFINNPVLSTNFKYSSTGIDF